MHFLKKNIYIYYASLFFIQFITIHPAADRSTVNQYFCSPLVLHINDADCLTVLLAVPSELLHNLNINHLHVKECEPRVTHC